MLTAVWLTLFLGAALVASGIMRIFLAFNMQARLAMDVGRGLCGFVTLVLGLIILAHWPFSAVYTLGIFLGVDLVFAGASWIGLGLGLRNADGLKGRNAKRRAETRCEFRSGLAFARSAFLA